MYLDYCIIFKKLLKLDSKHFCYDHHWIYLFLEKSQRLCCIRSSSWLKVKNSSASWSFFFCLNLCSCVTHSCYRNLTFMCYTVCNRHNHHCSEVVLMSANLGKGEHVSQIWMICRVIFVITWKKLPHLVIIVKVFSVALTDS